MHELKIEKYYDFALIPIEFKIQNDKIGRLPSKLLNGTKKHILNNV